MTKNPIHKRSSRSGKEHPGCMGGILSIFDFNQSHGGRKLLTDKKCADHKSARKDKEVPITSLDVSISNESLETPKSRDFKIEHARHAYETRKNSAAKKKGGLPMKALIAEEMSKELELRHRTPSVVARLMGLDALPSESMLADHNQASKNYAQNNMLVKQQRPPKPTRDAWFFSQKWRASASKTPQKLHLLTSQQQNIDHRSQRMPPEKVLSQEHPQEEKQLQEFKKKFEASQASKIFDYSKFSQLDEFNMHLVEKHMLVHEKLDEAKMTLVRQKFIDAKHLATDEKLRHSKEFLDALDVLQSNRDLFLKFLEEPNSLFAKHLQDLQSTSQPFSHTKRALKMKPSNVSATYEVLDQEDISQGRHSKEGTIHDKCHQKQKGPQLLADREEEWQVTSSSSGTSAEGKKDICSLPTRIVVLKPGSGSTQNVLLTSSPSCSPQCETVLKNQRESQIASTGDFLQEVRERLKVGVRVNRRDDSWITRESIPDQIHDGPKDPKEIAREIARYARDSVNSVNDPPRLGSTFVTSFAGTQNSLNKSQKGSGDGMNSYTEVSTPVTKHSLDYANRFGGPSRSLGKSLNSSESTVNREAKKHLLERLRLTHGDEKENLSAQNSSTLEKMLAFPEDKKCAFQSKNPKESDKIGMEIEDIQLLPCQGVGTDCKASLDDKIGDQNGDVLPKNLLRSQSVPASDSNFARSTADAQSSFSETNTDNAHEMVPDMSSISLPMVLNKTKNDRSIFKGKVSSLKGSFLLRGRKSSQKKSDYLDPMQPDISIPMQLDEVCDPLQEVPVESEGIQMPGDSMMCYPLQEAPMEQEECKQKPGDLVIYNPQKKKTFEELEECGETLGEFAGLENKDTSMRSVDAPCKKSELLECSEECNETPGNLVDEDMCAQSIDAPAPHGTNELLEIPSSTTDEIPLVDDTGSKGSLLEASDCTPDSVESDIVRSLIDDNGSEGSLLEALCCAPASEQDGLEQSGDDIDYGAEEIPLESLQPSSPTSCSADKSLPPDGTCASEINNEKPEQPSPVSVLDSPFPEEISSAKDFNEISSNLRDLRLQLHLLRFDDSEKPEHKAEGHLQGNSLVLEDCDIEEADTCSENGCNSPSLAEVSAASRFPFSMIENVDFESVEIDDIPCPKEKKPDLLYVRNVLVASGFTEDGNFARWHLRNHPLDPLLFEKIENLLVCDMRQEAKNNTNDLAKTGAHASRLERHLLFDCINEVLLQILGPFFNYHPWVQGTKLSLRPVPAGKQLLKETWAVLSYYLYKQSETRDTLESIVAKDLARELVWMELRDDIESVGCEIEEAIFNDLIKEAVFDLVS